MQDRSRIYSKKLAETIDKVYAVVSLCLTIAALLIYFWLKNDNFSNNFFSLILDSIPNAIPIFLTFAISYYLYKSVRAYRQYEQSEPVIDEIRQQTKYMIKFIDENTEKYADEIVRAFNATWEELFAGYGILEQLKRINDNWKNYDKLLNDRIDNLRQLLDNRQQNIKDQISNVEGVIKDRVLEMVKDSFEMNKKSWESVFTSSVKFDLFSEEILKSLEESVRKDDLSGIQRNIVSNIDDLRKNFNEAFDKIQIEHVDITESVIGIYEKQKQIAERLSAGEIKTLKEELELYLERDLLNIKAALSNLLTAKITKEAFENQKRLINELADTVTEKIIVPAIRGTGKYQHERIGQFR